MQGNTGVQGIQGETGVQGTQGDTGVQGTQGDTGVQGIQGETGVQGTQGETGVAGVAGETGVQGDTGVQGIQGETGAGVAGETGVAGIQGDTGVAGIQGETGVAGIQGVTGVDGVAGETGAGIQGETGVTATSTFTIVEAADTTARAMGDATYTDVIFSIEDKDELGEYNPATGIFTAGHAGTYAVSWDVGSASAAWATNEYWISVLSKNDGEAEGSMWRGFPDQADTGITRSMFSAGSAIITLAATDTLRIKVVHNQGAAVNTGGTEYDCYFHIARVTTGIQGETGVQGNNKVGLTIESPTATEDVTIMKTNDAITIRNIESVMVGSDTTSIDWTLRYDSDRDAAGTEVVTGGSHTTSDTTGDSVTVFNEATIDATNWLWLETTDTSGTSIDSFNVTLWY